MATSLAIRPASCFGCRPPREPRISALMSVAPHYGLRYGSAPATGPGGRVQVGGDFAFEAGTKKPSPR